MKSICVPEPIVLCLTAVVALLVAVGGAVPAGGQEKAVSKKQPNPAFAPVTDRPGLPRVLLIGDSISIGYTPSVQALLEGKANVHRPPTNCAGTTKGLESIDEWIVDGSWDVIHFNWGLHDLKHVDAKGRNSNNPHDPLQASPEQYGKNLEKLVQRLKRTGAKLIFATTTPYHEVGPLRDDGQEKVYNAMALKIMKKQGVKVNDLYTFALPRLPEIQIPNNVHFTPAGYKVLAQAVAEAIQKLL